MDQNVGNIFSGIISGLIVAILTFVIGIIYKNKKFLFIFFKSWKKKEIRFSISYLFRIKINNKYLLIEGNRIDQYQPIGGVYKYYDSFKEKYDLWNITNDDNIPYDEASKKDLRVRVPRRYIFKFLKWFESRKNREVCVFREFSEEVLKEIPISDHNIFYDLKAEYIKTNITGIRYSQHFKIHEILIADIFDLNLTNLQEQSLIGLEKNSEKFKFVCKDEIEKMSPNESKNFYRIGENAIWTL